MKIIVATSENEISSAIETQFKYYDIPARLSIIETMDDFIEALKCDKYDLIVADYSFDGIDIWQMAKLIHSTQLAGHALPLYMVEETCDTEIPLILAKESFFQVIPIVQLPRRLQAAYQHNRSQGYMRGPATPKKPSVLLIEDDDDAAEVVYLALTDSYDVDRVCDGRQGVISWTEKRHDLVLLDFMLPGLNGDEVLAEIMEIDKNQPVVIMTAYDKPEYNKNFILNGASQYLPKPFMLSDLRTQCQLIINKAKLIYQTHYTDMKLNQLSNLVYELDHHLSNNNIEKSRRVLESIKNALPNNLTNDDQIKWGLCKV